MKHKLVEKLESIREEAFQHKKAVRYHRRRLRDCMSLVEQYEKELAEYGIKLEIQSQEEENGKERPNPRFINRSRS